ncbi:MAG: BBP7 family outer membrane beta-barrel protein [Bacteroidales bacterium]|nr:BBP7 family outer membrane beta-barrel protein [Bacteroidales bacterium]
MTTAVALARPPMDDNVSRPCPAPSVPLIPCLCEDRPALLPVPETQTTPPDTRPDTGPKIDYDRSLLYLPDTLPESPRTGPVTPDPETLRIWMAGGLFFGWSSAPSGGPNVLESNGMTTRGVFGTTPPASPFRTGFRFDGGVWLNEPRTFGIEAGSLYLPQAGGSTQVAAGGPTSLLIPVNPTCGCPTRLVSFAGPDRAGVFTADWSSRFVSADIDLWRELYRGDHLRIAGTAGYRFGYLAEDLTARTATMASGAGATRFLDHVGTNNQFHGGQLGLTGGVRTNRWTFDLSGEIALGSVFSTSNLTGSTAMGAHLSPGGIFARPANSGRTESHRFAVLPTVSAQVSRQFSDHGKLFVGYTLHYLTDVVRPGNALGPSGDPGDWGLALRHPVTTADFWVQGVNLGVEWEY